jgi:hypothetical protein
MISNNSIIKKLIKDIPSERDKAIFKTNNFYLDLLENADNLGIESGFKDFECKVPFVSKKIITAFKTHNKANAWLLKELLYAVRHKIT